LTTNLAMKFSSFIVQESSVTDGMSARTRRLVLLVQTLLKDCHQLGLQCELRLCCVAVMEA
jgi:hypothetical protein